MTLESLKAHPDFIKLITETVDGIIETRIKAAIEADRKTLIGDLQAAIANGQIVIKAKGERHRRTRAELEAARLAEIAKNKTEQKPEQKPEQKINQETGKSFIDDFAETFGLQI